MSKTIDAFMGKKDIKKILALNNGKVIKLLEEFLSLCKPKKTIVVTDSPSDILMVKKAAIAKGEEINLKIKGHTIHFDGYQDQARDKENTRVLLPKGMKMSKNINTIERNAGLKEIYHLMDGIMRDKECFIRFFSLGPKNSIFTMLALQITDSAYVAHSEDILYRPGYEEFKKLNDSKDFFTFIHSAGRLLKDKTSKEINNRRIFVDIKDGTVYSVNNQYAGNSLGLKKLALRLAFYKANNEDWLTEHMLIMGVHPPEKERVTYFTGAFPSACGKTSTSMLPGQTILGDDISYIRIDAEGNARAVNIESGVFGIIRDINPVDDPLIFNALTSQRELIFSNVLVHRGNPYWLGMGLSENEYPEKGTNHSGAWWRGKKNADGKEIPLAHPNARYTIKLSELDNADTKIHDPEGVIVQGILYGGRDSDTTVPIVEAKNWEHGVYMGATIESETTTATIGTIGLRKHNPMAMLDFMVVPLGQYITNHTRFGQRLRNVPKVFSTNYFLKHKGEFTNNILDKLVWVVWAEGRVHKDFNAIKTPIGYIPTYQDLKNLFRKLLNKTYLPQDYEVQFSIRIDKYLEKIQRMEKAYEDEDLPSEFWKIHYGLKTELTRLKLELGNSILSPTIFD